MNKITISTFIMLLSFAANKSYAQLGIGTETITNSSVLLEFGGGNKGIILPAVANAPDAVSGTFVFNTTSLSLQMLENGTWINLTDENEAIPHSFSNAGTDIGEGVIIGAQDSVKPGILVLESTTQALVLPQVVDPHLNMQGTIAGTMVYDTVSDTLAVFDGINWSYWR